MELNDSFPNDSGTPNTNEACPRFDWPNLRKGIEFCEREKLRYIPLIWGARRPAIAWKTFQNRPPNFSELAEWFHEGKPTNVGIICGGVSNGLVALCFNAPNGAMEFFGQELWHKLLASTFIVKTPRGVHVYLRSNTPMPSQFVAKGGNQTWLEIRADGNYIAAPPSLHPSGVFYENIGVEYAKRFKQAEDRGLKCVLLYCGDHDPDGLRISEFIRKSLEGLEDIVWSEGTEGYNPDNLEIERFGLNYNFIETNKLPWIDDVITGSKKGLASHHIQTTTYPMFKNTLKLLVLGNVRRMPWL